MSCDFNPRWFWTHKNIRDAFPAVVRRITIEKTPTGIEDAVASELCYVNECQFEALGFVKAWLGG